MPDATVAVFIVALRDIAEGDELLLDYGPSYWSAWSASEAVREAWFQRMDREALQTFQQLSAQLALPTLRLPSLPPALQQQYSEREYLVERLVARREREGVLEYQVKWDGYATCTWETDAHLRASISPGVMATLVQELPSTSYTSTTSATCSKRKAQ
jgi:hypothetical protein